MDGEQNGGTQAQQDLQQENQRETQQQTQQGAYAVVHDVVILSWEPST